MYYIAIQQIKYALKYTEQLNEYFELNGGRGDLKWIELAKKFKITISQAQYQLRKWQQLELYSKTIDKEGRTAFKKYRRFPKKPATPKGDFAIKKYTTYNGKATWITHEKKSGAFDFAELQGIVDSIKFKKGRTKSKNKKSTGTELVLFSDVHIGMSSEGNLFDLDWSVKELFKRIDVLVDELKKGSDTHIAMLGDYTDGMKSKTNRGGHILKQNMTDKQMYMVGLKAMVYLIDSAAQICKSIHLHWVSNSNHPGVMDYVIGQSLKKQSELRYSNVKVDVLEDSFTPIEILGKEFIFTHGYDEEYMKRGLPRFFADKEINKIMKLRSHYKYECPIVLRGDLHQYHHIDYVDFSDCMVKAFSPPSGWISTNFFSTDPGGFAIIEIGKDLFFKPFNFK